MVERTFFLCLFQWECTVSEAFPHGKPMVEKLFFVPLQMGMHSFGGLAHG